MPSFRRRVGALADVKELEYLAALHQTCFPRLRENGTVSSLDIRRFLMSRSGLIVSPEDGIRLVRGFGGGIVGDDIIQSILNETKISEEEKPAGKKSLPKKIKPAKLRGGLAKLIRKDDQLTQEEKVEELVHERDIWSIEPRLDEQEEEATRQEQEIILPEEHEPAELDLEYPDHVKDDNGFEQEEYLDLVQLTAVLLMPTLARAAKEWHEAHSLTPPLDEEEHQDEVLYKGARGWFRKLYDSLIERQQQYEDTLHESLRPKPHGLIADVLSVMIASVNEGGASTSDSTYPAMNAHLVRQLLLAFGEVERAADPVLVESMVQVASSTTGLLDEEAFVTALTWDLQQWMVGAEDDLTTAVFDVIGFESYREKEIVEAEQLKSKREQRAQDSDDKAAAEKEPTNDIDEHQEATNNKEQQVPAPTDDIVNEKLSTTKNITEEDNDDKAAAEQEPTNDIEHQETTNTKEPQEPTPTKDIVKEKLSTTKNITDDDDAKDDYTIDRQRTPIVIDYSIDAFSSITLSVAIFFFFMCTSLVYASLIQQIVAFNPSCGEDFGCELVSKVITWMLFAVVLSLTGYLVIIPLSIGNSPFERSPLRNFAAFVLTLIITWIPYAVVEAYKNGLESPYDGPEKSVEDFNFNGAQWMTRAIGTIVAILVLIQFLLALVGLRRIRASTLLSALFVSSHTKGTARTKRAATRKLNTLLENARNLMPNITSERISGSAIKDEAIANYLLRGERYEPECGGMFWTWKRVLSGALFDEEGVWICSRLVTIQTAQLFLFAFVTYSGFLLVGEASIRAEKARAELEPGYPQWVFDFVPTSQQVRIALYPALAVAMLVMLVIFLIYIPSYTGRVIQFRCGMLPSLKSEGTEFIKYRVAVDAVYTNIGNAIFAMTGSGILFFFIIGLVIFLFIWPFSRGLMLALLAWLLGLAITIVLKQILVTWCRKRQWAGFYRLDPMGADLASLALDCWFIGLGGGVFVGRLTQFIFAACFFVGRTDVPFLSKDVALFGYAFDYVPTNFVKDILVHEAHRHPYFERLLAMYFMKLKNDSFCSEAGACWRQLFVVALMPWFMKLRVFTHKRLKDYSEAYNARRLEGLAARRLSVIAEMDSTTTEVGTLASVIDRSC